LAPALKLTRNSKPLSIVEFQLNMFVILASIVKENVVLKVMIKNIKLHDNFKRTQINDPEKRMNSSQSVQGFNSFSNNRPM